MLHVDAGKLYFALQTEDDYDDDNIIVFLNIHCFAVVFPFANKYTGVFFYFLRTYLFSLLLLTASVTVFCFQLSNSMFTIICLSFLVIYSPFERGFSRLLVSMCGMLTCASVDCSWEKMPIFDKLAEQQSEGVIFAM